MNFKCIVIIVIYLPTEHLGILKNLLKHVRAFHIEYWNLEVLEGENWSTRRK